MRGVWRWVLCDASRGLDRFWLYLKGAPMADGTTELQAHLMRPQGDDPSTACGRRAVFASIDAVRWTAAAHAGIVPLCDECRIHAKKDCGCPAKFRCALCLPLFVQREAVKIINGKAKR